MADTNSPAYLKRQLAVAYSNDLATQCTEHAGILFLRHVTDVEGVVDNGVLNLLMRFLAEDGSDDDVANFITQYAKRLDLQHALRICTAHRDRIVGQIHIHFALGNLTQAIDLCLLSRDEARAKQLVKSVKPGMPGVSSDSNSALQQRVSLWQRIVAHVASQRFGARNALNLIAESNGDVNVSHVIPHLSGDIIFSEFEHELLQNVKDFHLLMKRMGDDIERARESVEMLRGDVQRETGRVVALPVAKVCSVCHQLLLAEGRDGPSAQIVVFRSCSHGFHSDCLDNDKATGKQGSAGGVAVGRVCRLCDPGNLSMSLRQGLVDSKLLLT